MSEPLHDIDKLFHDGIEGHTEYPPSKVWDKIEAGLDRNTAIIYKKKYKAVKTAAIILLLLFMGVIAYEVVSRRADKTAVDGIAQKPVPQENSNTSNDDKTTDPSPREAVDPGNTQRNDDNKLQNQESTVLEKKENLPINQPSDIPATGKTAITDNKKKIVNDQEEENKDRILKKEEVIAGKQKANKKQRDTGNVVFNIEGPGKSSADKIKKDASSQVQVEAENNKILQGEQVKRALSFFVTPSGPSKRDIITGRSPAVLLSRNDLDRIIGQITVARPVKQAGNLKFRKAGFSLSAYFLPGLVTWNTLRDDKPPPPPGGGPGGGENHNAIKKTEQNNTPYSGGLKLGYDLSKRISLLTGVNYTKSSTSIDSKKIFAQSDNNGKVSYRLDCSSGYTFLLPHNAPNPNTGDSLVVSDNQSSLSYLGIPLSIEYKISSGKISLSASAGGQVNVLLKGKTRAVFNKGTTGQATVTNNTKALRSTYFSAITSITGELQLNKKLSLTIAPSGQFGLTSINSGGSVKTRSNYLGLAAGLKWRL